MPTVPLYQANCSSCGLRPSTPAGCHHETEALTTASKIALQAHYTTVIYSKLVTLETQITQLATCRMIETYNTLVMQRRREYATTMAEAAAMPFYTNYTNAGGRPDPALCPPPYARLLWEKINGARARYHRKCNRDWVRVNKMLPVLLEQAWEGVEVRMGGEVVWGVEGPGRGGSAGRIEEGLEEGMRRRRRG